jgi:hypothetical protein
MGILWRNGTDVEGLVTSPTKHVTTKNAGNSANNIAGKKGYIGYLFMLFFLRETNLIFTLFSEQNNLSSQRHKKISTLLPY